MMPKLGVRAKAMPSEALLAVAVALSPTDKGGGEMEYKECKFLEYGICTHEDCPKDNHNCIGKDSCAAWEDDISHKGYKIEVRSL